MTDDDLALTVPCPYFYLGRRCAGNTVGAPCRNMVDGELRRPHAERVEAARKARVVAKAIADLPDLPMPFSAAQRAEVLDTVIDDHPTIGGGPVSITFSADGMATIAHGGKQWWCGAQHLRDGWVSTHPHFTSPVPWVDNADPIPAMVLCRAVALAVRWADGQKRAETVIDNPTPRALSVDCPEPDCAAWVDVACRTVGGPGHGTPRAPHPSRWALVRPGPKAPSEPVKRPLVYMAHPVAPSAEQIDARVAKDLGAPTADDPPAGVQAARDIAASRIIRDNLRRARRWLRWFSLHVPQWVVIAPWIAAVESVLEAGVEEREEREREMVVCREVASRCAAVVQVGGRVSSGMAEEGAAARAVVDLTWAGEEPPADAEASAMLAAQCEVGRG